MLEKEDLAEIISEALIETLQSSKPFSKELKLDEPNKKDIKRIVHEFIKDSTRARPIFLADVIDKQLALLIKEYLIKDSMEVKTDSLLGDFKPIYTFSSRITCGYRLGLFSESIKNELKIINKIRVEFAHNWLVDHFDVDATKYLANSKLYGLISEQDSIRYHDIEQQIDHANNIASRSEFYFLIYVLYLYSTILTIKQNIKRLEFIGI